MARDAYSIVKHPLLSEKGTRLGETERKYIFKVGLDANKIEIKKAIEELYKVKVEKVCTMRVKGKTKRFRGSYGKEPDFKKAVVTLQEGESISFV